MRTAAIVAVFLGTLIIVTRGHLLLFPAAALRWFGAAIRTKARVAVAIAALMIWSGAPLKSGLESVLFIFGIAIVVFVIPMLVLVPAIYMDLAQSLLPDALNGTLLGWRIAGLVGLLVGVALVLAGVDAL